MTPIHPRPIGKAHGLMTWNGLDERTERIFIAIASGLCGVVLGLLIGVAV